MKWTDRVFAWTGWKSTWARSTARMGVWGIIVTGGQQVTRRIMACLPSGRPRAAVRGLVPRRSAPPPSSPLAGQTAGVLDRET